MAAAAPDRGGRGVPVLVLVNRGGGTAATLGDSLASRIESAFAPMGIAIDLCLVDGADLATTIAAAGRERMIVVGGGDGTLGCAATVLAGSGTVLGILPLGTRNHLARELGIPLDLKGAAKLIVEGSTRTIDVGRVGERVFVNNASIGLYPALIRRRDENPAPKWLAALPAALGALGRLRHHRLRLVRDGDEQPVVTPLLFVGNNRYTLDRAAIGTREALDAGLLSVFAVASRHRWALIGFALRAIAGRADPVRDFAAIGETAALTVHGHTRHVDVALDGEVTRLPMPLHFRSDAGALTVMAPPANTSSAPSLRDGGASPRSIA